MDNEKEEKKDRSSTLNDANIFTFMVYVGGVWMAWDQGFWSSLFWPVILGNSLAEFTFGVPL